MAELNIKERQAGDVTVLDMDGKITIGEGSVALRTAIRRLLEEGRKKILLNLAGVGYIDSSGIGELVSSYTAIDKGSASFIQVGFLLLMGYVGLTLGANKGDLLNLSAFGGVFSGERGTRNVFKILDTSVIIDGRIADVCETGFVEGMLVIPQFVLRELQLIADSSDSLKRNRGRRGLDILQRIQKMAAVQVQIDTTGVWKRSLT